MEEDADYLPNDAEVTGDEQVPSSPSILERVKRRDRSSSSEADLSRYESYDGLISVRGLSEQADLESPFRRQKGVFSNEYLDLLNRDIEDVANHVSMDEEADLPHSQIGLTVWTPLEKKLFFEALSRLGRDNLPGIASRVGTKSEMEVRQYVLFLQEAADARDKRQENDVLEKVDIPAARELSQQCCRALDEAADAISVRQERHEEAAEEDKWGACWNLTSDLARHIDDDEDFAKTNKLKFAELFRIATWLKLPERVFMNASYPENNWQYVGTEPPTIRATALEDFHSIATAITKKLVLATVFIAQSRIRAKKVVMPWTRDLVRRKDVEAALASLGMESNSKQFWAKCAGRLRLEVYENDIPTEDNDTDEEPMSYDMVERELLKVSDDASLKDEEFPPIKLEDIAKLESSGRESIPASEQEHPNSTSDLDDEDYEVNEEAEEVLLYSAHDFPDTHRTRDALKIRIRTERAQEQYAEVEDARANYEEESRMWALLSRPPPDPVVKKEKLDRGKRSTQAVDDIYDVGNHWRKRMKYHSEWETIGQPRGSVDEP